MYQLPLTIGGEMVDVMASVVVLKKKKNFVNKLTNPAGFV